MCASAPAEIVPKPLSSISGSVFGVSTPSSRGIHASIAPAVPDVASTQRAKLCFRPISIAIKRKIKF
jgi:hypothetical protein